MEVSWQKVDETGAAVEEEDITDGGSESGGGGGGSAPESGWGKDKDEDERAYARRCLKMAHSMCKPKPRQRSFHR